jgi:hypothetical protein
MILKRPEGASEILGIMLLIVCYTLLCLVLMYLIRPDIFTPVINTLEKFLHITK